MNHAKGAGASGDEAQGREVAETPEVPEVLQTERLRLRWFHPSDAPWILALLNSPGWLSQIGDRGVHDLARAAEWIDERLIGNYHRQGHGFWAVEERGTGTPVGMCGLVHRPGLPDVDLGYAFLPQAWGRGLAREAARACLAHGHQVLGLRRILAITLPGNVASQAVLAAIGMQPAGEVCLPGDSRVQRLFESLHPGR